MPLPDTIDRLNGCFGINKASALDAFQMFYEELISTKPANNRIRRLRSASTSSSK